MSRVRASPAVQDAVLTKSRRRCAVCYGLYRDGLPKKGQIAHIDRDSSNSVEDNLIYLCLEHHDEYDSKTSQTKGLTAGELRKFRAEVHEFVQGALNVKVHFGEIEVPAADPYAGKYTRLSSDAASAEITLMPMPDNLEGVPRYAVGGLAMWGGDRPNGPNLGELGFIANLNDDVLEYEDEEHAVRIRFADGKMIVEEDNWWVGVYGKNVNFIGEYQRSGQGTPQIDRG